VGKLDVASWKVAITFSHMDSGVWARFSDSCEAHGTQMLELMLVQ
jgi:hypothetical protein